MNYTDQLKDIRWKRKRLSILIRDKFTCKICGYFGERVNVHHLKYTGMAWNAPDADLITLCRSCHKKLHIDKLPVGTGINTVIEQWLKGLLIPDS